MGLAEEGRSCETHAFSTCPAVEVDHLERFDSRRGGIAELARGLGTARRLHGVGAGGWSSVRRYRSACGAWSPRVSRHARPGNGLAIPSNSAKTC